MVNQGDQASFFGQMKALLEPLEGMEREFDTELVRVQRKIQRQKSIFTRAKLFVLELLSSIEELQSEGFDTAVLESTAQYMMSTVFAAVPSAPEPEEEEFESLREALMEVLSRSQRADEEPTSEAQSAEGVTPGVEEEEVSSGTESEPAPAEGVVSEGSSSTEETVESVSPEEPGIETESSTVPLRNVRIRPVDRDSVVPRPRSRPRQSVEAKPYAIAPFARSFFGEVLSKDPLPNTLQDALNIWKERHGNTVTFTQGRGNIARIPVESVDHHGSELWTHLNTAAKRADQLIRSGAPEAGFGPPTTQLLNLTDQIAQRPVQVFSALEQWGIYTP